MDSQETAAQPLLLRLAQDFDTAAAALERSIEDSEGTAPRLEDAWSGDVSQVARHERPQWRDAGTAQVLREAAEQLREWDAEGRDVVGSDLPVFLEAWLTTREIEYAASADAAMSELTATPTVDAAARFAAVARAAFIIGMGAGIGAARTRSETLLRRRVLV